MDKEQIEKILNELRIGIIEVEYEEECSPLEPTIFQVYCGQIRIISDIIFSMYEKEYPIERIKSCIKMENDVEVQDENSKYKWKTIDEYYDLKNKLGFKNIIIGLS